MRAFKFGLFISLAALLSVACNKNEVKEEDQVAIKAAGFKSLQTAALKSLIQKKTFKAEDGVTFLSDAGTEIRIDADCLTLDGVTVSGDVELRVVEIYDRGTMLATNKTVVGKKDDGTLEQLLSGGQFLVQAFKGDKELQLNCDSRIIVPANLTGGAHSEMQGFDGTEDSDGNVLWEESSVKFSIEQGRESSTYLTLLERFGWFNCDYFAGFSDPKTELTINVPAGYNNSNSNVYIALKGRPNTLARIYGAFPIGLEAHIIFVSADGDDFVYDTKSVTIANGHTLSFAAADFKAVDTDGLVDAINALP